jgi:hypothetical protein
MTFDELWRRDLARRSGSDSVDKRRGIERFDNPALAGPASDTVDEAEMNRFLDWLEKSLL